MEGVIYLARDGNYYKIGWSSSPGSVRARWHVLQVGNPRKLEMRMLCNGDRTREATLHALYHETAVRGEWFLRTPELDQLWARATPCPPGGKGVTGKGAGRPPASREAAILWIGSYLAKHGSARAGDLLAAGEKAGHSRKTLRRAADQLGVMRSSGGGPLCRWRLP